MFESNYNSRCLELFILILLIQVVVKENVMRKLECISVIIPVYNAEKYLARCVESIRFQTYTSLDIILIDDGSTDASGDICDYFQQIDKRIRVIHKCNEGIFLTRQQGIKMSQGDYISFVDADDWIEPDMYEKMMSVVKRYQCDAIVCKFFLNFVRKNKLIEHKSIITDDLKQNYLYTGHELKNIKKEFIFSINKKKEILTGFLWDKLIKKNLFLDKYKYEGNVSFGEDQIILWPALLKANSLVFIDEYLYHYFQHDRQSRFMNSYHFLANIRIYQECLQKNIALLGISNYDQQINISCFIQLKVLFRSVMDNINNNMVKKHHIINDIVDNSFVVYLTQQINPLYLNFKDKICFWFLKKKMVSLLCMLFFFWKIFQENKKKMD